MVLPVNIDATYPDRGAGDTAHQQHHDEIHAAVNSRGAANGVATLDAGGLLPDAQSPAIPRWRPNTAYAAGDIRSAPDGSTIRRDVAGTSAAAFDAPLATPVLDAPTTATTGGTLTPGTYSYRVSALNALGETLASAAVSATIAGPLAAPVLDAPTTATTGGTLAAGTYYYKITALNAIGETVGSNEVSQATTGTTSTVDLSWAAVAGATGYKVYRATATGGTSTSPALVATLGAVTSYTDTGTAVSAGAVPGTNTTSTNTNTVTTTWAAVTGATGYKVYGRTAGGELLIATLGAVTTYTDTGAVTPAGALPTTDTTAEKVHWTPVLATAGTMDQEALDAATTAVQTNLDAHLADAVAAHAASAVSYAGAANLAATDVEAALDELDAEKIPLTQKAAANGVATLDAAALLPEAQVPTRLTEAQLSASYAARDDALHRPGVGLIASAWTPRRLTAGRPVLVASDGTYNAFPGLTRTDSGRLVGTYYSGESHTASGAVIKGVYSEDGGATWVSAGTIFTPAGTAAYKAVLLTPLGDESVVGIGWRSDPAASPIPATIFLTSSADGGETWTAEQSIAQPFTRFNACEGPIAILGDGSWIAAAYGSDTSSNNYSVAIGRSTDQGATWTWTTIADGVTDAVAYTEPTIAVLPSGRLHLLIRNTTDQTMYRATSDDDGTTWTALTAAFGGEGRPFQLVTSSGLLICLYRATALNRIGVMRASADGGVTWTGEQFTVVGRQTNNYAQAVEVSPGVIGSLIAQEYTNSICEVLYFHVTEPGSISPFGDSDLRPLPLPMTSSPLVIESLDRRDESPLYRADTSHKWITFTAPTLGHQLAGGVIKQMPVDDTPAGCASAFDVQTAAYSEIATRVQFGATASTSLLFGMSDLDNRYMLSIAEASGNVTIYLYKRLAATTTVVQSLAAQNLVQGQWYDLRVTRKGSRIRATIDGEEVIDAIDADLSGRFVGVQTVRATDWFGPIIVA